MASLKSKSNDLRPGIKSHGHQQRKRGRPPFQSSSNSASPGDENSQRRERVRLAQRAYRNRKDMEVDGLKATVARLEHALEQTIKSFTRFQNLVIGVDNLPPKIALEISRTALHIASVAQKAHSGEPLRKVLSGDGGSGKLTHGQGATEDAVEEPVVGEVWPTDAAQISSPSNSLTNPAPTNGSTSLGLANTPSPMHFSPTISMQQQNLALRAPETGRGTWFTARLLRLCSEKGVQLLTSPTMTYDDLHPALSIHLTWVTVDELRTQYVRTTANNFEHTQEDPDQSVTFGFLDMYRSIEGSDGLVVPRMPKLEPQQLIHGRTRTKLGTNLRDFQGEWLEPIDVQEYLEQKGSSWEAVGRDANAIFTEEIQRSRIMSTSWPFGMESQDLELEVPDEVVIQAAESQAPALARQNDSLVTSDQEQFIVAQSLREYQTQSDATQYIPLNQFYPPEHADQLVDVTLHLDRLIDFLVGAACCIGSGPGIRKEAVEHALRVSMAAN